MKAAKADVPFKPPPVPRQMSHIDKTLLWMRVEDKSKTGVALLPKIPNLSEANSLAS